MTTIAGSEALTRVVDGREVPRAGVYALDPSHSEVGFVARHLVVAKVRGRFSAFSGTIEIAEQPTDSSVEVEVDVASIDTRDATRDEHLRSADFFDVARYPSMTFRSTGVRPGEDGRWLVDGDLTIRGVTRPITLETTFEGAARDPWGGERIAFSARAEVDREEWGLTWNQALEAGGVLVGRTVVLEIEAEAIRKDR